ncbi:hypothetical protein ARHIZOSPH14_20230 [Agromyces rhizosphaerae]|uniref:DUF2510 domain-containing protein n=1 Tax=Agromyces rhizosphaerae TaxID=88374 RepID=A0A9W6FPR0_9MICO|nr:DUF2510 domain-containing protein [Agromyces rhizosphaerae]GLI27781.1 hypothetical protein ARHIZOSPH14_20230 [Agromyces rhizosphaerae]
MRTPPPSAPAGWYDDPDDATRRRYWDGAAWTDRTEARTAEGAHPTAVLDDHPTEVLAGPASAVPDDQPTEVFAEPPAQAPPAGTAHPEPDAGAGESRTRWWLVAAAVIAAVLLVGGITTAALLTAGSDGSAGSAAGVDAADEGAGSDADGSDAAGGADAGTEPGAGEPEPEAAPAEPAEPVDPVAFAREAERRLDRMERDIDALEKDIEDARFARLVTETVRLAVRLDELRAIGTPDELAGVWESDLDAIGAEIDRLAEAVIAGDGDAAEDAADGIDDAIGDARSRVETLG